MNLLILLALVPFASWQGPRAERAPASVERSVDPAQAVERGAAILLDLQEGGEGSAAREWPYEGVYRVGGQIPIGYRIGGTSICGWALIETPAYARSSELQEAVVRGLEFVLEALDDARMGIGFGSNGYDVRGWGHTYALTFLLRLRERELVPGRHVAAVDERITWLVRALEETEIPGTGGWNYSRRSRSERQPAASPFMTAPTLIALYEAASQGEVVDAAVVERALSALEAARNAEGVVAYTTAGGRDSWEGATGRAPVTEVALYLAGRGSLERVRTAVDSFLVHWEWLEKRRRRDGTHEPPFGIAPYYFFYAHYYAALAVELLPEDERPERREAFLERLFSVREGSGGWNDRVFPRSENFGTAMSLLALLQPQLPLPPHWATGTAGTPRAASAPGGGR